MTPLSELPFLLRWLPVALVFFLYLWTIYTYVVEICIYMVPYLSEKIVYLVVFSLLLIMSVWSYLAATFTQTAKVPYQFFLTEEELQSMKLIKTGKNEVLEAKGLKLRVQARTMQGGIRYCSECKCIKPDRTHHCSTCQRCILKMDHHCPWINNCVCYSNYKFFLLFLFYTTLFCFFVTTTSLQYFIKFWQSNLSVEGYGKFNILILFFLSIIFTISLFSLLLYHAYLTKVNRTTLESMRAPIFRSGADKRAYNKGAWSNVVEVFGSSHFLALLPLPSPLGDGITFTPRISPIPAGYQSLENVHHHHNNHRNHSNHNNNHRLITSSVAMTPPVLTEVVAVQPDVVQDH